MWRTPESDVALLSDEDPGNYAETLQKASDTLRIECQEFVLQQLEPASARLATLEEYFSQQHWDLLHALRNTEGAGSKEGDTAHKEWQRQAQDDMRWGRSHSFLQAWHPPLHHLTLP